jgi:hypothetical protein
VHLFGKSFHTTTHNDKSNQIWKHEIPEILLEYPCVKKCLIYSSPPIQHPWWISKYRAATHLYLSHILWDIMVKVGRKCSQYSMTTFFTSENCSKSKFNVKRVVIINSSSKIAAFLWKPPTSLLDQSLCGHGLMQKEKYTTLWQSPDHRLWQMHVVKVVSEYIWLQSCCFSLWNSQPERPPVIYNSTNILLEARFPLSSAQKHIFTCRVTYFTFLH